MTAANKPLVSAGAPSAGGQIGQRLLDRIGNTPLIRLERTGKEYPNVEILRQGRVVQSRRLGEGSRGDSMIREASGAARCAPER